MRINMKRFNKIFLVICLISSFFLGNVSFSKDIENTQEINTKTDLPKSSVKEDYRFPLDDKPQVLSIFDYNENSVSNQIRETTVEKTDTVEYDEAFVSRDLELSSETVDFYPETSQYVAKGNAILLIPQENMQMKANEIIIDQRSYEIIGIGNVKIVKDGADYYGDYIRINTKKESSFFKNPILYFAEITINSDSATMYANETIAKEGSAIIEKNANMVLSTSQFGSVLADRFFDPNKQFDSTKNNYKIIAKKILVKRAEDRTDITLKSAKIYRGKHLVGYSPSFTFATDKDVNYIETSFPEFGNRSRIGTYVAPSLVMGLPNASTLKAGPLMSLNTDMDFGIGAFARLNTPKSQSNFMYSSATGNFLVDASYKFTDNLRLNFVGNDYIDTGWMGGQMPNYGVELVHEKFATIEQANLWLRNRVSAGLFDDNRDYGSNTLTTARYKWQVEGYNSKPLLNWEKYLMLGYAYQHDLTLYQTGERAGVLRAGPRIYSDLGRLLWEVTYFAAGQYEESPFIFDRYRYGKNNVRFRGQYYINKYLSIAYYASANLSGRDYEDNWLTENQFIASVGTEDLKLRIGFDTVRNSSVVGFDMLLGSNKALVEFDEMKVVDFDARAKEKSDKKEKKKTKL